MSDISNLTNRNQVNLRQKKSKYFKSTYSKHLQVAKIQNFNSGAVSIRMNGRILSKLRPEWAVKTDSWQVITQKK